MGMIHAFNFTCHRDRHLSELMETTLYKHCPLDVRLKVVNTDTDYLYSGYGNGAGWPQGMMKIAYMKTMSFSDDDWVLSVDSDVVFCNPYVFKALDPKYGIIGVRGQQPWDTIYGKWAHMSGCLIFLRGDIVKEICSWSDQAFDRIRHEQFKTCNMTENEDVMISYFAYLANATQLDISSMYGITSSDFEVDVISYSRRDLISSGITPEFYEYRKNKQYFKSFYHLNYNPDTFLGEPINGAKWEIPRVLKMKGIEL